MSISLKGFIVLVAAIVSIPAAIATVLLFLGTISTLKFDWMHPIAPYIYSCIAFAALMWFVALAMDYIVVRRAAMAKPSGLDPQPLVAVEKEERIKAVDGVYQILNPFIQRTQEAIHNLTSLPVEKPLKQRTTELAHELLELLKKQGPKPTNPLSAKVGCEEHGKVFDAYFDWEKNAYFKYMAYFRDRVVRTDYELAAEGIMTKLEPREIDPADTSREVDIKKIAEALLLTASHMPDIKATTSAAP